MDTRADENERRDGDLLRMGVVEAVDGALCTVRVGDLVSGPIAWFVGRAGKTRRWSKVSPGEQGLLFCPEGDIAAGLFLPGVASTAFPAAATEDVERVDFEDGTIAFYDPQAHALTITLAAGGRAELTADGGIKLVGPLRIEGDIDHQGAQYSTGAISSDTDVIAAGVSGKGHHHAGVKAGPDLSGPPVAG